MAQAKEGDTVHIHYTGRLNDGTVFDSSEGRDPLSFTLGAGQVIPGFDDAVSGMEVGEARSASIPPESAYGPRRDELKLNFPVDQFPEGVNPEVGQMLQMQTGDGQPFQVQVTAVGDEVVELDANHPLAGQTLNFEIELVKID